LYSTTGSAGDINVNDAVTKTGTTATTLTLQADNNINLNSSISSSGSAMNLVLQTRLGATNLGTATASLGGGTLSAPLSSGVSTGVVNIASGIFLMNGGFNVDSLNISGGSVRLDNTASINALNMSAGTLVGAGQVNVNNGFSQTAGTINKTGSLSINQAVGDLMIGNITADTVSLTAVSSDVYITNGGSVTATGRVSLTSPNGAIRTDSGYSSGPVVTALDAIFIAKNGIHGARDTQGIHNPMMLNVNNLDVKNTGTDDIQLMSPASPLALKDLNSDGFAVSQSSLGYALIFSNSGLSVLNPISVSNSTLMLSGGTSLAIGAPIDAKSATLSAAALNIDNNVTAQDVTLRADTLNINASTGKVIAGGTGGATFQNWNSPDLILDTSGSNGLVVNPAILSTVGGFGTVTASSFKFETVASWGGDILVNSPITVASPLTFNAKRNVVAGANITATAGSANITLNAGGLINQTAGVISGALLTTSSVGGQTLNDANAVTSFKATNTTSGNIALTNTATTLTITGISNTATNGDVTVNNTGAIATSGAINTGGGTISLTASGGMTVGAGIVGGMIALISGGELTESGSGDLRGTSVYAKGSKVVLTNSNSTGVIAGEATGTASGDIFSYTSFNGIQVTAVSGAAGVKSAGGDVVLTGNGISQYATAPIISSTSTVVGAGGLSLTSTGSVVLQNTSNNFANLAASTGTGSLSVQNSGDLTLGAITSTNNFVDLKVPSSKAITVGGFISTGAGANSILKLSGGGITYSSGAVTTNEVIAFQSTDSAQGITLASGSVLGTSGTRAIDLVTDKLTVVGTGKATTGTTPLNSISISPFTSGNSIVVGPLPGTPAANTLYITDTSTTTFSAPDFGIGSDPGNVNRPASGAISVDAPISRPSGRVGLFSSAGVMQTAAITASSLGVIAGGPVVLNATNMVSNLAGTSYTGGFAFTNGQSFNITTLSSAGSGPNYSQYGLKGVTSRTGDISLVALGTGSDVTANTFGTNFAAVDAINGNVTINAERDVLLGNGTDGKYADVYASDGSTSTGYKNISITAGRDLLIDNYTYVAASGDVTLTATTGNIAVHSSANQYPSWVGAGVNGASGNSGTGGVVTINAPLGSVFVPAVAIGVDLGGGSITTGSGGRWLVYASSPSNVTKGSLTPTLYQYNTVYGGSVATTGSGLIYASPLYVDANFSGTLSSTYGSGSTANPGYTLRGLDSGDTTTASTIAGSTITYSNWPITSSTAAGSYNLQYSGLSPALAYSLTPGSFQTYIVNPAALSLVTASLTGMANKTYDGNNTATLAPGNFLLSGFVSTDLATVTKTTGTYANKNVGSNILVNTTLATNDFSAASGTNLSNYTLPTSAYGYIGSITPAFLSVGGLSVSNKVYDATTLARLTGNTTFTGLISGDQVSLSDSASASFADKNVGSNKPVNITGLALTGSDAGNYTLALSTASASADITPAFLSVSGLTAQNKVYDASTLATLTGTASVSALTGDNVSVAGTAVGTFADKNVASAKTVSVSGNTLSGSDAANYTLAQQTGLSADITQATLLYEATPSSRDYGQDNPLFFGTVSGYRLNDTLAAVASGTAVFNSPATSTSPMGQYAIDGSGLTLITNNYLLAQAAANATALTINQEPPALAAAITNAVNSSIQQAATSSSATPAPTTTTNSPGTTSSPPPSTSTSSTASSSDSTEKKEAAPPAKPVIVTVANTTMQKPAEQMVTAAQPTGRVLICR